MPDAAVQFSSSAGDAIRRYDDLKFELAAIAQAAMLQCGKQRDEEAQRSFQQLLARIAEDRFNLAVVGPFSRGKSSLMNAILGFNALPTGVLPHTSVITTVTYGPRERILVRREGWSLSQEIGLDQLAEYVTESGNAGNSRRVTRAEIQLPAEILRRGLHFIDTPGVGSAIVANTRTAERFLPEVDAAIFVSSFDFPISEADIEFLRKVRANVGVVFFVLNKLDLVSESEREEVSRFVGQRLDREPGVGGDALFAVSAKRGLEAKLRGDSAALAQSGLTELEAALAAFMAGDKTRQLAMRLADRLVALLQRQVLEREGGFATGSSPELAAQRLDTFQKGVASIKARHAELVTLLAASGNDAANAIAPRVDIALANLKRDALKKFLPVLLAGKALFEPRWFDAFTGDVSGFCQRSLSRELRIYEAALIEQWQRSATPLLAQIRDLPDELLAIASGQGNGRELPEPMTEEPGDSAFDLELGGVAPLDWRPRLAWWVYFVPRRWFGGPIEVQLDTILTGLLAQYRSHVEEMIRAATGEQVNRIGREIEKRVETVAARVIESFRSDIGDKSYRAFEELLVRAKDLRERLNNKRVVPAEDNQSSASNIAAGASASAVDMLRGCPVCRAVVQAVFEHLGKLQYELSVEADAQTQHAKSGGFCAVHTWIYANLTSPVAISRAYPALLDSHATKLGHAARSAASASILAGEIRDLMPSPSNCPACSVAREAAGRTIDEIFRTLEVSGSNAVPALCLPHLAAALEPATNLESSRLLAAGCAEALSRAADNMRRHALKHDAIRGGLMTADEREAHELGLKKLAGDMLLALPPPEARLS